MRGFDDTPLLALGLCAALLVFASEAHAQGTEPNEIQTLLQQGRIDEATQALDALGTQGSAGALLLLARIESRSGDLDGAIDALQRALDLAPNSEDVLSAYAQVQLAGRRPGPAILALEALARMVPEVPQHAYLLGVARLQVGELQGAVEALQDAVRLDPSTKLHHIALGLAYNRLKQYEPAGEALRAGLRLDPENAEAVAALAEAEHGVGRREEAERLARRALTLEVDSATAHLVLGMLRMEEERYEEARDSFLAGLEVDPDAAKIHYQASLAYARLGDRESSRRHLDAYRKAQDEAEARLIELRRQGPLTRR